MVHFAIFAWQDSRAIYLFSFHFLGGGGGGQRGQRGQLQAGRVTSLLVRLRMLPPQVIPVHPVFQMIQAK